MTPEFVINHLWQSSCFVLLAALLAFVLRKNPPKVRYWVWLSASLKFLMPLALLVSLGRVVPWPARRAVVFPAPVFSNTVVEIAESFTTPFYSSAPAHAPMHWAPGVIGVVWVLGFLAIAFVRCRSWFRLRATLRASTPIDLPISMPAFITPGAEEPGVVGFLRPVLVLPAQLLEHLNPRQLDAVLAHELCHVSRRDNLFAGVHMVVEAIFWFHPLVWWIGSRMVEERELACDEEVLRMGCEPADYVAGILNVCRLYKESPLPCVSGVTGADVKKRLRAILTGSIARELTTAKKLILAGIGLAAFVAPVAIGALSAPRRVQAQSQPPAVQVEAAKPLVAQIAAPQGGALQGVRQVAQPVAPPPEFEVASVRRGDPVPAGALRVLAPQVTGGVGTPNPLRVQYERMPLGALILIAFAIPAGQISGEPDWMATERYDIVANIPPGTSKERFNAMLGNLLRERFGLRFHMERRTHSVYLLRIDKKGPKLRESNEPSGSAVASDLPIGLPDSKGYPILPEGYKGVGARGLNGETMLRGQRATIGDLIAWLGPASGRLVVDETGLTGHYDFEAHYLGAPRGTNPNADEFAPDVFAAVQVQLGLKLENGVQDANFLVIDSINRDPTEN